MVDGVMEICGPPAEEALAREEMEPNATQAAARAAADANASHFLPLGER